MEILLERLSSTQIVAVISVVCGCIVGLAMIVAISKYQFQLLADDTALKRERQQAELALKQKLVERGGKDTASLDALLRPEVGMVDEDSEQLNAELAKRFGALDMPGEVIEATLTRTMTLDPARKRTIIGVLDELLDNEAAPAAILAAIRPLCGPATKEKEPAAV